MNGAGPRRHAYQSDSSRKQELLESLAGFDLTRIQISCGIGHELVYRVELPRVAAIVPHHPNYGSIATAERPDHVVRVVGHQEVRLPGVV